MPIKSWNVLPTEIETDFIAKLKKRFTFMQTIINSINKIIDDDKSGSVELVKNLINIFLKSNNLKFIFYNHKNELINQLTELKNKQNTFVNLVNFINRLLQIIELLDYQWFVLTINAGKKYYDELNNLILQEFLKHKPVFNTCLLHSNSSTIKNLFNLLKTEKYKIHKIYQTISFPGNEGKIQADFIKSIGYNVQIIDENNLLKYINDIDVAIFGADVINKNLYFINKIKTKQISKEFKKANKQTIMIADKNKIIASLFTDYDKNLFEKIPCDLITYTINA